MNLRDALAQPSPWRHNNKVDIDFPMLAACLLLMGIGIVMIASESSAVTYSNPYLLLTWCAEPRVLLPVL